MYKYSTVFSSNVSIPTQEPPREKPSRSAMVKNAWSYMSTFSYTFKPHKETTYKHTIKLYAQYVHIPSFIIPSSHPTKCPSVILE
jgi:hypothetical protein